MRKVFDVEGADFPDWYPSSSVVTAGPFAFTASMSGVDFVNGGLAPAAATPRACPTPPGTRSSSRCARPTTVCKRP